MEGKKLAGRGPRSEKNKYPQKMKTWEIKNTPPYMCLQWFSAKAMPQFSMKKEYCYRFLYCLVLAYVKEK